VDGIDPGQTGRLKSASGDAPYSAGIALT
jgi:hypothetical protein